MPWNHKDILYILYLCADNLSIWQLLCRCKCCSPSLSRGNPWNLIQFRVWRWGCFILLEHCPNLIHWMSDAVMYCSCWMMDVFSASCTMLYHMFSLAGSYNGSVISSAAVQIKYAHIYIHGQFEHGFLAPSICLLVFYCFFRSTRVLMATAASTGSIDRLSLLSPCFTFSSAKQGQECHPTRPPFHAVIIATVSLQRKWASRISDA